MNFFAPMVDQVVGQVMPAGQRLDVLPADDHVGVQPLDDPALRGAAPVLTALAVPQPAGSAISIRAPAGAISGSRKAAAAVVDDDHLHEVVGIGLRGQGRQGQVEPVLTAVRGDDHAHRQGRRPPAERAADPGGSSRCAGSAAGRHRFIRHVGMPLLRVYVSAIVKG